MCIQPEILEIRKQPQSKSLASNDSEDSPGNTNKKIKI